MRCKPIITVSEYEHAREQSDEIWDNYDVFDEERDRAPLRDIVLEVVEGQYTHPSGPDSVYGMENSGEELVWDKVFSSGLVPSGIPDDVREEFAQKLGDEVRENAGELYTDVRDQVDPESDASLSEVQTVLESRAKELVNEEF